MLRKLAHKFTKTRLSCMLFWELMGFFRTAVPLDTCELQNNCMVFTCHSRWVTKGKDIMMKMVPQPVFGCSYYGFCTCHFCFGSYSKYLLIMLYVKLMTQTRVWEWNSVILFLRKSTWFFSRKAKIKIDDD